MAKKSFYRASDYNDFKAKLEAIARQHGSDIEAALPELRQLSIHNGFPLASLRQFYLQILSGPEKQRPRMLRLSELFAMDLPNPKQVQHLEKCWRDSG